MTGHNKFVFILSLFLSYDKTFLKEMQNGKNNDSNEKNLIGNNLKLLRKQKHISQQELSNKLETLAIYICRGSISRIEDKSRTVTDIELYGLSKVLNVPIEKLFEFDSKES